MPVSLPDEKGSGRGLRVKVLMARAAIGRSSRVCEQAIGLGNRKRWEVRALNALFFIFNPW